jgi:murein DD-endopeptidase MepM/ murein hydrolase activator NlpD
MPKHKIAFIFLAFFLQAISLGVVIFYFSTLNQPQNTANAVGFSSTKYSPSPVAKDIPQIANQAKIEKTNLPPDSKSYLYDQTWKLPFRSGTQILLDQGYNGTFSHQNKYALDFPHADNIDIVAARGGKIIELNDGGKWDQWCISYTDCDSKGSIARGNHIIIQHTDGTRAKYLHFKPGSIPKFLSLGDFVVQGTFLGKMGSTGYTCLTPACTEPDNHLRFEVMEPLTDKTLTTIFSDCNNPKNICNSEGLLIEGKYYIIN